MGSQKQRGHAMSDNHPTARIAQVITSSPGDVAAHTFSTGAILGAFLGYLPNVAAGLAALWYMLVIWESKTVQGWVGRRRPHKTEEPTPDDPRGQD